MNGVSLFERRWDSSPFRPSHLWKFRSLLSHQQLWYVNLHVTVVSGLSVTLTPLHRCALATNLSTSVLVSHGQQAHAAKRRSFGIITPASCNCILRILLRKRLSPAGARCLREAPDKHFESALQSALDLRQVVHFEGVVPSS